MLIHQQRLSRMKQAIFFFGFVITCLSTPLGAEDNCDAVKASIAAEFKKGKCSFGQCDHPTIQKADEEALFLGTELTLYGEINHLESGHRPVKHTGKNTPRSTTQADSYLAYACASEWSN